MTTQSSTSESAGQAGTAKFAIVILAAGKGTRLKSRHPKVLHQIAGKTLLGHVVTAAMQIVSAEHIFAIIGHEAERVREALAFHGNPVRRTA